MNKDEFKLEIGDVVQLDPDYHLGDKQGFFAGCLMIVDEVHDWGAQGYIHMTGERGLQPPLACYRARYEEMAYVGKATWVIKINPAPIVEPPNLEMA